MKLTIRKITIKFVTLAMIGVMGMLVANKIVFTHVHKLSDGTTITHAHPYNKSNDTTPYKCHHHSNKELLLFQEKVLFFISFLIFALPIINAKKQIVSTVITEHKPCYISLHKSRAPPSFIL